MKEQDLLTKSINKPFFRLSTALTEAVDKLKDPLDDVSEVIKPNEINS